MSYLNNETIHDIKRFFIVLSICFPVFSYSQTNCDCYERLSKLAELYSSADKNDSALITFERALKFLPDSAWSYNQDIFLATYLTRVGRLDSAQKHLIRAVKYGYTKDHIKSDREFTSLVDSDYWNEINITYRTTDSNFNWTYLKEIHQIHGSDQNIRRSKSIYRKNENGPPYYFVDSSNLYRVLFLVQEYGFPAEKTHGFNGNSFNMVLLHAAMYSEDMYRRIIRLILNAHDKGLSDKSFIPLLHDRRLMWVKKEKQKYGSWNSDDKFSPIENVKIVDSLRYNYNLLSLQDFAKKMKLPLPEGYEPQGYPKNYFCTKELTEKENRINDK